jgi:hypothetical protein
MGESMLRRRQCCCHASQWPGRRPKTADVGPCPHSLILSRPHLHVVLPKGAVAGLVGLLDRLRRLGLADGHQAGLTEVVGVGVGAL